MLLWQEVLVHMFLEKLAKGGRQEGFFEPTQDGLGYMMCTVLWGGVESGGCFPLSATFYLRKGGARKITESKRQTLRKLILEAEGIDSAIIEVIDNEQGSDPWMLVTSEHEDEQPKYVCLSHLGSRRHVAVKRFSERNSTHFELGERRIFGKLSRKQQHEQTSPSVRHQVRRLLV